MCGAICGGGDYFLGRNCVTMEAPYYDPWLVLSRKKYDRQSVWHERASAWAKLKRRKLRRSLRAMMRQPHWGIG